jgi:AcrR family transcriptional regulator
MAQAMAQAPRPRLRSDVSPAARRGPGRPARLSREGIVKAAIALLEREPGEPLTVARIAAAVEAAPAALYRHVARLDELLDAVLGEVLGTVAIDVRRRASWPQQVRDWMSSVRDHLLRYPAVLPLLGRHGRTSPAWLETVSVLIGILEGAGLSGVRLALAHLWIAETTMGMVMLEASLPVPQQIANARASLVSMSPEARERLDGVLPYLAKLDGDALFAFTAARAVEALSVLVDSR